MVTLMKETPDYNIEIDVSTNYLKEQSSESANRFVFSYTITLKNIGNIAARLISRHWVITNANGEVQEVTGIGVVGEQPFLLPGDEFKYSSGSILETPVGTMEGTYTLIAEDKLEFKTTIPPFTLSVPHTLH